MPEKIDNQARDILFNKARTYAHWEPKPVDEALLKEAYDLAKMGPTSANCQPMRIVFVSSEEGKAKLKPCLMEGNVDQTMSAPVTAIICQDMEFYEKLPEFFPHTDARSWFVGKEHYIEETAFRNSSLQGAYFIMAARALGLDCGPMSGFDKAKIDEVFLSGTNWKSNFLINLGYGDASKLHPRSPRPEFDEMCKVV